MTIPANQVAGVPRVGDRVYTADGESVGLIKEVSGSCFKVDAPVQPDYWLAFDCVVGSNAGDVRLGVAKRQLDEMWQALPNDQDHTGIHIHDSGSILL